MHSNIVWNADEMTESWFSSMLADAGILKDGVVSSAKVTAFGGGVLTNMVRAELTYSTSNSLPSSVLVKYPSADAGNRKIAEIMGLYELEVGFYRDIAPQLTNLNMPSCYLAELSNEDGGFTLVLEDCSANTTPGSSKPALTAEECANSLVELARFQAPHWGDQSLLSIDWLNNTERTNGVFDAVSNALEGFLARFGKSLDPEHIKFLEKVLPKASEWVRSWRAPMVLQHGEFRGGNVLLSNDPSNHSVTMIDFQTVRIGPPGVDPAYFMGGSMSASDRRKVEQDVLKKYYQELLNLGVKDYSWDDCWEAYRAGAMYGVYLLVGMAGQVEPSERNDEIILTLTRQYAEMAIDLDAASAAGLL